MDALRRLIRRFTFSGVDDSGKESYADVEGMKDEKFTKVLRVQQHGFSSHPPKGSHAIGLALNGSSDMLVIIGGESGDKRPSGTAEGDSMLYNGNGAKVHLEGDAVHISGPSSIVLSVGGCSLTISGAGFAFSGGSITHDGVPIDKTHVHKGVTTGAALSGVPNS